MRELDYQKAFVKFCRDVLGYEILESKNDKDFIPDAWVKVDEEEIPVEVKRFEFNEKALNQLQNYMNHFGASKGVAVGSKLTVELPKNIVFYKHSEYLKAVETAPIFKTKTLKRKITVIDNINAEISRFGLTQTEFCELIGFSRKAWARWSAKGDVAAVILLRCSKIFGCSADYLMRDVGKVINNDTTRN